MKTTVLLVGALIGLGFLTVAPTASASHCDFGSGTTGLIEYAGCAGGFVIDTVVSESKPATKLLDDNVIGPAGKIAADNIAETQAKTNCVGDTDTDDVVGKVACLS